MHQVNLIHNNINKILKSDEIQTNHCTQFERVFIFVNKQEEREETQLMRLCKL